jgi:hypothetical protein
VFFLLKSQRADLHKVLEENQLNPGDFEIVPSNAQAFSHERGEQVRLKGTDYYFSIYPNDSIYWDAPKFCAEFSPGEEQIHDSASCENCLSVCYKFAEYLAFLQREVGAVDPWKDAENFSDTLRSLPETALPNTPIGEAEQEAIRSALERIETKLLEHVGKDAEKEAFVKRQFRLLNEAVSKFGRKDYLMLLYTAVIGIATTIRVPPQIGMQILEMLRQLVEHTPKLLATGG